MSLQIIQLMEHDKESTSYNDIFDAFRLALKFYHFQQRTD
jgi:hypothetical protein